MSVKQMRIPKSTRQLLELAMAMTGNKIATGKSLLEIGSYRGESTRLLYVFFRRIVCVDRWAPYPDTSRNPQAIITNYNQSQWAEVERDFDRIAGSLPGVEKLKGSSADIPKDIASFDACYIDGDHTEDGCSRDILTVLPLMKPHALVCGDDYCRKSVRQAVANCLPTKQVRRFGKEWMVRL